jgi:hypothetical protein
MESLGTPFGCLATLFMCDADRSQATYDLPKYYGTAASVARFVTCGVHQPLL